MSGLKARLVQLDTGQEEHKATVKAVRIYTNNVKFNALFVPNIGSVAVLSEQIAHRRHRLNNNRLGPLWFRRVGTTRRAPVAPSPSARWLALSKSFVSLERALWRSLSAHSS